MQSCLVKIRSAYSSLQNAEKRVADYVLENTEQVVDLPIREFAKKCGISVATVARFCLAIGVKSYKTFKIQLAQDIAFAFSDIYQEISPLDTDVVIVEKVFKANVQSLYDTLKVVDIKRMQRIAWKISKAEQVVLFGAGGSGAVVCGAVLRFAQLGIPAEYAMDSYQMVVRASKLKKGDVAIGVSHSGRTKATLEGLRCAKQQGAGTVAVTNYLGSVLAKESDTVLVTAFCEPKVKATALASHVAQLGIFDALYVLVAKNCRNSNCVQKINESVEDILRYKSGRRRR